jgi:hypothetical protein
MQTFNSINAPEHAINRLRGAAEELLSLISEFNDTNFNEVPFPGSWTAAQVADHIRKSIKGLPSVLEGNAIQANRKPEEKFEQIQRIFLDFQARYQAPEFIIPAEMSHPVAEMSARISKAFDALLRVSVSIDLSLIYADFEVPMMGKFTGFEWIEFVYCHTMRHIHQLRNIHNKLVDKLS